ncbi:putative chitinase [Helianthus anomalus]
MDQRWDPKAKVGDGHAIIWLDMETKESICIGAPAAGIGPGNEGAMLYSDVQQFNAQNNARMVYDTQTDVNSVKRKVQYAKSLNIGGYFFWTAVGDQDWKISRLGTHSFLSFL